MGLDASVMCNCFKEGKTTPAPFPPDWFEIDTEGYLNLKNEYDLEQNWRGFDEWERSCCEHKGMHFSSERIANWHSYRLFQAALADVGWQNFPTLQLQLPNANGGLTLSTESRNALLELEFFVDVGEIGKVTSLIDVQTNQVLHRYVAVYDGIVLRSGRSGVNAGLNETEFFAVDRLTDELIFQSKHFKQLDQNGKKIINDSDTVVWQDIASGKQCVSDIAISGAQIPWDDGTLENPDGKCRFDYPTEFRVESRTRLASDFEYITNALKTVFTASVKTGNPVRWC